VRTMTIAGGTVSVYGLIMALAALFSVILCRKTFRLKKISDRVLTWAMVLTIPLAVLFGRAAYCCMRAGWFGQKGIGWYFQFGDGGFVLFGAILGAGIAVLLTARITGEGAGRIADAMAQPACVMIFLGRLAEIFAGEGYGWAISDWFSVDAFDAEEYTGLSIFHLEDASFFERLPFAVQDSYGQWCWAVCILEALIAVLILIWLIRGEFRADGDQALTFLLLYSATQIFTESMRQDSVLRWGFVKANQIVGAVVFTSIGIYWARRAKGKLPRAALRWCGVVLAILVIIAMEFAVEKKIVPIEWLPADGCYLIEILACAGIIACILGMRDAPFKESKTIK